MKITVRLLVALSVLFPLVRPARADPARLFAAPAHAVILIGAPRAFQPMWPPVM